jgi:hypothetical protein
VISLGQGRAWLWPVFVGQYFSDSIAVLDLESPSFDTTVAVEQLDVRYLGYDYSSGSASSSPYSTGRRDYAAYPIRTIALSSEPILTLERQGELLFHDATICMQSWQSCASCHPDGRVDGLNWDLMNDDQGNPRMPRACFCPPGRRQWRRAYADGRDAVRAGTNISSFPSARTKQSQSTYLRRLPVRVPISSTAN